MGYLAHDVAVSSPARFIWEESSDKSQDVEIVLREGETYQAR